jgi:3-oxoacyl-[acyl-carrier protein] reductase
MGKLDGKVAIVTGAGRPRGLGRSYALALAKEGCSIVINDIDDGVEKVAGEIIDAGGKAISVIARVGLKDTADKLVETAVGTFGRLDILVNNAGMVNHKKFVDMDEKSWDEMFLVHVKGAFLCTQSAVKWMIANHVKGRIIYITSTAGIYGADQGAHYCACKSAVIGLTKSNSIELARYGICVNAVAPGALTMDMENLKGFDEKTKEALEKMSATNVLQKSGLPEDVAPAIVFLASDDAHYITGQVIAVTGNTGVI